MVYVTADLHGYSLEKFQALLQKAGFSEEDFLFIIGDVVDRGDHGAAILKWLTEQPNIQLILGNHEAMMLSCAFLFEEITEENLGEMNEENLKRLDLWRENGGDWTIEGLSKLSADERAEIFEYLRDCPLYDTVTVRGKNYLLVHGGLDEYYEGKKLREYTPDQLLWSRVYPDTRYSEKFITIVGHTPTCYYGKEYAGKICKSETWINVDAGASCGYAPAILRLDDMQEFYMD